jgi:hypothetical protein
MRLVDRVEERRIDAGLAGFVLLAAGVVGIVALR